MVISTILSFLFYLQYQELREDLLAQQCIQRFCLGVVLKQSSLKNTHLQLLYHFLWNRQYKFDCMKYSWLGVPGQHFYTWTSVRLLISMQIKQHLRSRERETMEEGYRSSVL